jgi:hypothetical protein
MMQTARKFADDLDRALLATDPRLNGSVLVVHQDGTSLHFERAFAGIYIHELPSEKRETFAVILTEHHGAHVYHMEDLKKLRAYGPQLVIEDLPIPAV